PIIEKALADVQTEVRTGAADRALDRSQREIEAAGKGVAKRSKDNRVVVGNHHRRRALESLRAGTSGSTGRLQHGGGVHHPIGSAEDSLRVYLVSETEAWTPVVGVQGHLTAMVRSGKSHGAFEIVEARNPAGDGRSGADVPIAQPIETLGVGSIEVPAQSH